MQWWNDAPYSIFGALRVLWGRASLLWIYEYASVHPLLVSMLPDAEQRFRGQERTLKSTRIHTWAICDVLHSMAQTIRMDGGNSLMTKQTDAAYPLLTITTLHMILSQPASWANLTIK